MTNETTQTPAPVQAYLDQYRTALGSLPGAGLSWLAELRAAGIDRFARTGFPTQRNEAFRFTSLRPLEKFAFAPAPASAGTVAIDLLPTVMPAGQPSHRLVFVDGAYRSDLSGVGTLPAGAVVMGNPARART